MSRQTVLICLVSPPRLWRGNQKAGNTIPASLMEPGLSSVLHGFNGPATCYYCSVLAPALVGQSRTPLLEEAAAAPLDRKSVV